MRHHITLAIFVLVSLLMVFSPAQAGTVALSPSFGPPGTTIVIGYLGNTPTTNYTCNIDGGADMGWIAQTSIFEYVVPLSTPVGTVIYVNCRQEWVDEPDASTAIFTVTAPDTDGDGVTDDVDACPTEPAPTPNGCPSAPPPPPDSDVDAIPDAQDACPFEFAQTQNGCPAQPNSPTNTPQIVTTERPIVTPQPTTPAYLDPNLIGTIDIALVNCIDMRNQAIRLPIGVLVRILGSGDPCGTLTVAVRDFAFGTPRDAELNLVNTALMMRGTCDTNDAPSPAYLRLINAIHRMNPTMAREIHEAIAPLQTAEVGSREYETFCAFMSVHGPSMDARFPASLNDTHRFVIAFAHYVERFSNHEANIISDLIGLYPNMQAYGYNAGMFLRAVNGPTELGLDSLIRNWRTTYPDDYRSPEDDALVTWLVQTCGFNWFNFYVPEISLLGSAFTVLYYKNAVGTPEEIALINQRLDCNGVLGLVTTWYNRMPVFDPTMIISAELTGSVATSDGINSIPREEIERLNPDFLAVPRNLVIRGWNDVCDESVVSPANPVPTGCIQDETDGLVSNAVWDEGETPLYGLWIAIKRYSAYPPSCEFSAPADYTIATFIGADGYARLNDLPPATYYIILRGESLTGVWANWGIRTERNVCIILPIDGRSDVPVIELPFNADDTLTASDINPAEWLIPENLNIRMLDDAGQGAWLPPVEVLNELGINNPSDIVSWRPPPIPPRVALTNSLAVAPPPNMDVQTVVDNLGDSVDLLADISSNDRFGMFISSSVPNQLFIVRNNGVGVIDLPFSPLHYDFSDDGQMVLLSGLDENGNAVTLFVDPLTGQSVGAIDFVDPIPDVTSPENAFDVSATPDGDLLTFVRDGNVFVQNRISGFVAQITNTGTCQSPVFDAVGFNLYFICDGVLSVYGLDGIKPIVNDMPVQSVTLGPVDGTLIFDDGQIAYLSDLNGANRRVFLRLNGIPVSGIRWQPPLPMPDPQP